MIYILLKTLKQLLESAGGPVLVHTKLKGLEHPTMTNTRQSYRMSNLFVHNQLQVKSVDLSLQRIIEANRKVST